MNIAEWKEKHSNRYAIAKIENEKCEILYTSNKPLKTKFELEFADKKEYAYIIPEDENNFR